MRAFEIGDLLLECAEAALASRHREYLEIAIQGDASLLKRAICCITQNLEVPDTKLGKVTKALSATPSPNFIENRHTLFSDVPSQALLAMLVILDTRNIIPMPE